MAYTHVRFIFRQDGQPSVEQGSGTAPATSTPEAATGWVRPAGSKIIGVGGAILGDEFVFDGTDWDQGLNDDSTFSDAADTDDVAKETVSNAAADAVGGVHAGFAGNDLSNNFPGPFTNPDVPRGLSFTFGVGWDGGDVTPTGTDIDDAACTEVITSPGAGGGVVQSTKVYKTVTSATKGAVGANPATCSIDTWHKLGLLASPSVKGGTVSCDGVDEAATWDNTAQCKSFTPTTLPNGAHDYVAVFPKAGATTTVTATP